MHRVSLFICLVSTALAVSNRADASSYSFRPLGQISSAYFGGAAQDVSVNGVVVGGGEGFGDDILEQAFRWTEPTGIVGMGYFAETPMGPNQSYAVGVSSDGSVVSGWSNGQAFRWTADAGIVGLGVLPASSTSLGRDISDDGSVIVGYDKSSREEAFRWTAATGMVGLGDLPGSTFRSRAEGVSPDGGTVLGWANSAGGEEAFRWTAATGMVGLGDLPGGSFNSEAFAATPGADVIVGYGTSASGQEAFRWTAAGGMQGLGDFPGGQYSSVASDITADGKMVVGRGATAAGPEAFFWTQATGLVNLKEFLLSHGVSEVAPWQLSECNAVSADGRYLVGSANGPNGLQAFIVTIPEPSTGVRISCGGAAFFLPVGFRRRCRGRAWPSG
jgi:probable HAF family extracellular repeat protein